MKIFLLITVSAMFSKCCSPNDSSTSTTNAKPLVSITYIPVVEGNDVVFTITLSSASDSATSINVATTPDTASPLDFTTTSTFLC